MDLNVDNCSLQEHEWRKATGNLWKHLKKKKSDYVFEKVAFLGFVMKTLFIDCTQNKWIKNRQKQKCGWFFSPKS